jgi:CRISPR system Cascade subunit CasA
MYNLLVEPLIRVRCKDGTKTALSLPAVLAGLSTGDLDAFIGLMRHQRHAWHAFLVQLAAIALDRAGKTAPPKKEAEWRDLLKTLTREYKADEPWSLVVEDVLKPAFMQPPVPEKSLDRAGFGNPSWFTDDLDILVTSKSHDVKMHRVRTPEVDHWSYALVTLQTCQGFLGAGNYGISRMNGGFASRPGLGFRHGHSWSEHFQRDVRVLLS